MKRATRMAALAIVLSVSLSSVGVAAAASNWKATGNGSAAAKATSLGAPSNVTITNCTPTTKGSAGNLTVTWTVSANSHVNAQAIYIGSGSPVTWSTTASASFANNTTASATFAYSGLTTSPTYTVGVQGSISSGNWTTTVSPSNNTFKLGTGGGSSGSCSVT